MNLITEAIFFVFIDSNLLKSVILSKGNLICKPPANQPSTSPIFCENEISGCVDRTVCKDGKFLKLVRQCNAFQICYSYDKTPKRNNLCGENAFFDANTNQCIGSLSGE